MFYGVFYTGLEAVGGTGEKGSHHLERLLNILYTLLHLTLPETLWGRFHQHLNFTGGEAQIWRACLGCKAMRHGDVGLASGCAISVLTTLGEGNWSMRVCS